MDKRFIVVAISREEARIWKTGLEPHTHPETLHSSEEITHHRVSAAHQLSGRNSENLNPEYFESISEAISGAEEILLIGHGKGKANSMLNLIQYLERKHSDLARRVVDSLDTDLENLSEGEILALAREWKARHPN